MKQQTEEIKIICAWCGKTLGVKEVILNPSLRGAPSHGICPECLEKMQPKD